jgi:hypothetical protein
MGTKPPVFIVGAPRSGTTLLRNILNRHPALAVCRETQFYHYVYARRRAFGDLSNLRNRRRLVEEYLSLQRIQGLGMDVSLLAQRMLHEAATYRAMFHCMLEFHAESQGKTRSGEKTPHHALFTETLCEWFPGAVILHLVRDPRDVVASLRGMHWAPDNVVYNARTWVSHNRAARRSHHRPGYLLVHYEKLVAQPELEVSRICAHLSEDFVPALLTPDEPAAGHVSWGRRAQEPITQERIGIWRETFTSDEAALIEWVAGEEMITLGYDRLVRPPSGLAVMRGLGFAALDTVRKRLTQFPGMWYRVMRPTRLVKEEYWMHVRAWQKDAKSASARDPRTGVGL